MYRRSVWSLAAAPLALALLAAAARGDIVAYYSFDADFTDATGFHHGTGEGGATTTTLSGEYVIGTGALALPDGPFVTVDSLADHFTVMGSAFSISLWFRTGETQGSDWGNVFFSGHQMSTGGNETIMSITPAGDVRVEFDPSVGTYAQTSGLNDDTWHFVAITQQVTGDAEIWVDGVSLFQGNVSQIDWEAIRVVSIGQEWDVGGPSDFFNGFVDDVAIWDHALTATEVGYLFAGVGTNYCQSAVNSSGASAQISAMGSSSVAANDLVLCADPMAPGEPGIFYYGPAQIQVPFGNGNRCVGGGQGTIVRMFPFAIADVSGFMSATLDNTNPVHSQFVAGATLNFQAWFRDPLGGGAGFNLSDGLSVAFVP